MLATLRGRAVSAVSVVVAAGALTFSGGTSAYADASVVAPFVPAVASVAEGACLIGGAETLGTACAIAGGAALIAIGGYFAWANLQQILNYNNPQGAGDQTVTAGGPMGWVGVPDASQPYDAYAAQSAAAFAIRWNYVNYHVDYPAWRCVDSSGNLSGWVSGGGDGYEPAGSVSVPGPGIPCDLPGLRVVAFVWYDAGNDPNTPIVGWWAGGTWAPTRQQQVTETCTTPGGSSSTTTVTTTYTNTGATTGTVSVGPCPSGTYVSHLQINDQVPGMPPHKVADWATVGGIESTYPNCFTGTSPGNGGCEVSVTYQGTACTSSVSACENWYIDSQYGTPGYGCTWGPYTIPLTSCAPLKYAYVPGNGIDTTTGLPKDPTATASASPTAGGAALPTTGTNPLPSPSSSAGGWVQPNPFPSPTGTATPVPEPPPLIGPTPGGSNCMDAAWGWNPVNWVVVPVECALTWAFVPDQAVVQQTKTEMSDAWDASGTGTFVTGAWSMLAPLGDLSAGDSGACGITVAFPYAAGQSTTLHLLDACTAPMSTFAPWVKGFLTAMVLFEGVYAVMRALGLGFGISMPGRGRGTVE